MSLRRFGKKWRFISPCPQYSSVSEFKSKKGKLVSVTYCFPHICFLSRPKTNAQWQESQFPPLTFLSVTLFPCFFFPPLLNLPCFPPHRPLLHHTILFHQVASHVRIIEASCRRLQRQSLLYVLPLPPTPLSPNALSLSTVYGVVSSLLLTCIL